MSAILIDNLHKTYTNGTVALRGIDLQLHAGQFTVILGPSGSGKSTLLRMMNGLETPSSGNITVNGSVLATRNLRQVRREVGMIFQHFNLIGRLNVMTNILTGRLAYRSWLGSVLYLFRQADLDIAHHALARVGLTDKAWVRADQLSGGQQQRIGIARALAQQPKVILADEPVASLDPVTSENVLGLLRDICRQDGIAVVANLHQVDYTRQFADRVVGLRAGKVVFDGAPSQLTPEILAAIYGTQETGNGHPTHKDAPHEHDDVTLAYA